MKNKFVYYNYLPLIATHIIDLAPSQWLCKRWNNSQSIIIHLFMWKILKVMM